MAPLYKKALVLGATSGIGKALAAKLIIEGSKVIVVGRRQELLDEFVKAHGSDNATAISFDVNKLGDIPGFVASVTKAHPDLDCVVVNSGVQRAFDFTKPETVDLDTLNLEMTTNYFSAVHITTAFLPHLRAQPQSHLVYVSATLGLVPTLIRTPNYNASKSALHTFIMNMRQQLKEGGQTSVRVVEVFPPAVQTELHDEKHQPDLVGGGAIGMPLDEYTQQMYEGLVKGDEQFAVGHGQDLLREGGWENQRQTLFQKGHEALSKTIAQYLKK